MNLSKPGKRIKNKDELLFYNLNKIKLSLGNILNIYFNVVFNCFGNLRRKPTTISI